MNYILWISISTTAAEMTILEAYKLLVSTYKFHTLLQLIPLTQPHIPHMHFHSLARSMGYNTQFHFWKPVQPFHIPGGVGLCCSFTLSVPSV